MKAAVKFLEKNPEGNPEGTPVDEAKFDEAAGVGASCYGSYY